MNAKMRNITLIIALFASTALCAQVESRTYRPADAPRYGESTGYGYDLTPSPSKGSRTPFFFSVQVPDGSYKVTVRLGSRKRAGLTTVRAESRRLFVENRPTEKGEFIEETFVVNKRTPRISAVQAVKIKERERNKLNWDDKLTLEFNGDAPVCESVRIEPADASTITVFLCGNSTVVDQEHEPWASWGQMIPRFFDDGVCIANHAESGESADTFIASGRLARVLKDMKPGDYLFIEFGHNDQKRKGPGMGAYYSFSTSLKTFVDEARARGARPVLLTPVCRRRFDGGRIVNTHEDYPDAIRWLSRREGVPLIDLQEVTRVLYESLGEEGSKKAFVHYPAGSFPGQTQALADNTHFNPYGAYQIARCVVEGVKTALPELARHLKMNVKYDPAQPDRPETFDWNASPFTETDKPDGN